MTTTQFKINEVNIKKFIKSLSKNDLYCRVEYSSDTSLTLYLFDYWFRIVLNWIDNKKEKILSWDCVTILRDVSINEFVEKEGIEKYVPVIRKSNFSSQFLKENIVVDNSFGVSSSVIKKLNNFVSNILKLNNYKRELNHYNLFNNTLKEKFKYNNNGKIIEVMFDTTTLISYKIISVNSIKKIINKMKEIEDEENLKYLTLKKYWFNNKEILDIVKGWLSSDEIINNPYSLLQIKGISLKKVDYIGRKILWVDSHNFDRVIWYIYHILTDELYWKWNTCIKKEELYKQLKKHKIDNTSFIEWVINYLLAKKIDKERMNEENLRKDWGLKEVNGMYQLSLLYFLEKNIAIQLKDLMNYKRTKKDMFFDLDEKKILWYINKFDEKFKEEHNNSPLHEIQKLAISKSLLNNVSIITGGAWTWKTTIIEGIVYCLRKYYEEEFPTLDFEEDIILLSPTGTGSKKMSEVIKLDAKTIHKGLWYNPFEEEKFKFNKGNKLPHKIIIIDEISMIDVFLMKHLLDAIQIGSVVVFVWDFNQLPSVWPWNISEDMIECWVIPVSKLERIYRYDWKSGIGINSHKVLMGDDELIFDDTFQFIEVKDKELEKKWIEYEKSWMDKSKKISLEEKIENSYQKQLMKNIWKIILDCDRDFTKVQVVSLTNKWPFWWIEINKFIQSKNPNPLYDGWGIKKWDKVLQVINSYDRDWSIWYDLMNWFQWFIKEVSFFDKQFSVKFNLIKEDLILKKKYENNLEIWYSCTAHKLQWQWFDTVIIPMFMDSSSKPMLYRRLFYTSITRGQKRVIIIGRRKAITMAIKNTKVDKRNSMLSYYLKETNSYMKEELELLNALKL